MQAPGLISSNDTENEHVHRMHFPKCPHKFQESPFLLLYELLQSQFHIQIPFTKILSQNFMTDTSAHIELMSQHMNNSLVILLQS